MANWSLEDLSGVKPEHRRKMKPFERGLEAPTIATGVLTVSKLNVDPQPESGTTDQVDSIVWGGIGGLTRVASPYVKIAEDSLKQLRAWMNEFGITPSSRSRVKVEKKAPVADTEDWFHERRN